MSDRSNPYRSIEEYHRDHERVAASMLNVFRRSRAYFHAKYVARTLPPEDKSTRFELGSACHVAVLEPDRLSTAVAVAPDVDRRTKAGREEFAAFEAEAAGRIVVSAKDWEVVVGVRDAVRSCDLTKFLVNASGAVETPIAWTDDRSGAECRALPDKVVENGGTVIDLKTTSDVSSWGFESSLAKFGYAVQAAHYLEAAQMERFIWIVVGITPPYEMAVYELDTDSLDRARDIHRRTLDELAAAYREDDWRLRPTSIEPIRLPKWVE